MASLLVLLACLGAGVLLRKRLDPAPLVTYVLNVPLPALALVALHHPAAVSAWSVASVWMVFGVSALFFVPLGRLLRWDGATVGCLVLACGLSNTSFVGFPLLELFIGPEAIPVAVPLDQLGSFVLVATVAPVVGAMAAGRAWSPVGVLRDAARFPALWAAIFALATQRYPWPAELEIALERIATTLSPVALVAVGAQLTLPPPAARGPLLVGLGYKLVLAPLLVVAWMAGQSGLGHDVTVLEAAMPPMVTGAVLAQRYGLRGDLAAALVSVGVPVSFLTVWGWHLLLGWM